uniref:Cdkn1a interacting zinc finger protein 1a n=1 Tax=Sander lucioperca TaxID=283035 RepID=A0A8C9YPL6_SANLU
MLPASFCYITFNPHKNSGQVKQVSFFIVRMSKSSTIPVAPQTAPPPRMVNLCQATQTTILAPNPMLQGALLMQQMQGNMRAFGMAGQQFRQFFTARSRSSLLGPVPMGMAIKSPMMGFPAGRSFHPHARYYNNNNTTPDRKRDSEQMAAESTDNQPAAGSTNETTDKTETGRAAIQPALRHAYGLRCCSVHSCLSAPSPSARLSEDDHQVDLLSEEMPQGKDAPLASPDNQPEEEDGVVEGASTFYCYLCSITCHNQQNFRSHMNSVSHQQRMMEIQHMSNACLVTLLPRVQESLQEAIKDGSKKADLKHWCATCHTHFTSSIMDHRRTEEHKVKLHIYSWISFSSGSSFFVPVAGFICRLCNKFYHFESSALHTHCKSIKHFENLKDSISTSATSTGNTDQELSLHIKEETTSQVSVVLENPAELPAGSREEPDSEPAAAAEDANGDEEEREAPAVPGKKNGTGKAKPKRRSGRATNRR